MESLTLQELGYVVDENGITLPQYVQHTVLNPTPGHIPYGNTANSITATTTNISNNRLWTGTGRDEGVSQYFNTK